VADSIDRTGLADFLRRRREQLQPSDVGLPVGVRRRTPGLRRDEVAALATMSTDYYTRLEQGRGPHPSAALLQSLARALRLTADERDHLFHLAGQAPPPPRALATNLSAGLLHLLDRLTDTPAFVVSDLGETLVQNPMARALMGEHAGENFTVSWFLDPAARARFPREDWPAHSRTHVADLRATYGRRRGDADVEAVLARLLAGSVEFAELWEQHEVAVRRADRKRVVHPEVGVVDLLCEVLTSEVGGQMLVVLYPQPGTAAREQLDLLRVIGTQDLTVDA
jgi:transcriptional regulator with XRE-family HTH domain